MLDRKNNTTATPADRKLSPWAEQLVKDALLRAPKYGSLQAKSEFLHALTAKLQAVRDYERIDPLSMESIVLKKGYREIEEQENQFTLCKYAIFDLWCLSGRSALA